MNNTNCNKTTYAKCSANWSELVKSVKNLMVGEELTIKYPTRTDAIQAEKYITKRLSLENRRYCLVTEHGINTEPQTLIIKKVYPDG